MITFSKIDFGDLVFINEVRNDCAPEYLHDSRTFTYEETIDWYTKTNPDFWIIWNDDVRIGYFRLSNYSEINRNIYIGADLHKYFRGKGLAYESYKIFIPFLFQNLNLHKISLEVLSTNERAINLYKKLGFNIDGVKRDDIYKNNIFVDSIIMSLFENELIS